MTIPDAEFCSVAGDLTAGAICSHLISSATSDMTFSEYLSFLNPSPQGANPSHGAAICMSTSDFNGMKTALEEACRELGKRCTLQVGK